MMYKIAITASLVCVIASGHAKELPDCRLYHVVKRGDTLGRIAQGMRMLPVQRAANRMAEVNEITDKNIIDIGDRLCVDEKLLSTGSQSLECYKTRTSEQLCMDSVLYSSAAALDLAPASPRERAASCREFHTIENGETLSKIALRLGLLPPYRHAMLMAEASNIENPNIVKPGTRVCIDKKVLRPDEEPVKCFTAEDGRNVCIDTMTLKGIMGDGTLKQKAVRSFDETPAATEPEPEPEQRPAEEPKAKPEPEPEPQPQPVPAPAPSPKQKVQKATEAKEEAEEGETEVTTGIVILPFLSYSRIDAVDRSNNATGAILSNPDLGAEFKVMQLWGESFTSEIFLQAERRTYSTKSGRTFTQHGGSMMNFGAGIGVRPFKRLELKLRGIYGDEFYFRAPSPTTLTIDDTKTLKADLAIYFDIMTGRYASTGLGGGARIIRSGYIDGNGGVSYQAKTGYGYFGTFYMRHKFSHVMLEESFIFEDMTKNTDLFDQKHMAAYLRVGAYFLF